MQLKRLLPTLTLLLCCQGLAKAEEHQLPPPPSQDGFVYFTADQATLEPNNKKINLTGNVTLIQKTPDGKKRTVTGENITFDEPNTTITSIGPITVEDGQGGVVRGQNVTVNYTTKDFKADEITTEYPPLRILQAKEISSKNGKQVLRKAEVTCCDCEDPHYTLSVGKLTLSPQKRVFGTNAVLKLDGFPVFYLPVFWRSLDSQKPWTTYVDFTQSDKVGFGVLTSSIFRPVLGLRPVLNLDYYTKSGVGVGVGLNAVTSPTLNGSGEFYYINDHNATHSSLANTKRWGFQGGYWWEMYDSSDHFNNERGALYQFQTQFRKVSDPYFNDTFFRSNPYIFMPDQETNISVSRQTRRSTLRVNYQEKDIFSWEKQKFLAEKRVLPEIKYMQLPFNDPFVHLTHRFEADFNNTSVLLNNNEEGPYQRKAHAKWTTEKSLRIARGLTFLPSVFYDQTVTFSDKLYEHKDAWVGRIGTDQNLQARTFLGSTNFGYQFTKRLSTGTLSSDQLSADKGIERNRLYLDHYYRPNFQTYLRFQTGFILGEYAYSPVSGGGREISWQHLKTHIDPLLLEIGYTSKDGAVNLFLQNQYDLIEKNVYFIAQSNFMIKNQLIGIGLNNFADNTLTTTKYQTSADRYTLTTTWGIRPPSQNWLLDLGIDASLYRGSLVGFNKLVRVARNFHDAHVEVSVRHRNHNLSFSFRLNILCGAKNRSVSAPAKDTYLYPWMNPENLRN